jgi:mono/diheme cytochrome c family protein
MTHRLRWGPRATSGTSLLMLVLLSVSGAWAQAADPSDIVEGGRLFRQKGNCQACHGWAGDGRKMDTQMPDGANLRESTLDRQNLIMTIKCGRPGTGMDHAKCIEFWGSEVEACGEFAK